MIKQVSTEDFTPVFLYKNDERIRRLQEQVPAAAEKLNAFIEAVERELSRTLKDEEKVKVKEEGIDFLINDLKEEFPFPKASDSFNYEAMGINLEPLLKKHEFGNRSWQIQLELEEGRFKASSELIDDLSTQYHYYTLNQQQNDAMALAGELYDLLIRMQDAGFATTTQIGKIREVTPLLHTNQRGKLEIRVKHIRTL